MGWERFAGPYSDKRMEASFPEQDLHIIGMSCSGATAHNLIESNSSTEAGQKLHAFLDGELETEKTVVVFFGEVDCSTHIGNHETTRDISMEQTIGRYVEFLCSLTKRPDVSKLIVASTTAHHFGFRPERRNEIIAISKTWNERLATVCIDNGWSYLDVFERFVDDTECLRSEFILTTGGEENHMGTGTQPPMLEAIRALLD